MPACRQTCSFATTGWTGFRNLNRLPSMKVFSQLADIPQISAHAGQRRQLRRRSSRHSHVLRNIVRRARQQGAKAVAVTFEPHPVRILRPDSGLQLLTPLPEKLRLLEATGIDAVLLLPSGGTCRSWSRGLCADYSPRRTAGPRSARRLQLPFWPQSRRKRGNAHEVWTEMGFEVVTYPEMSLRGESVSSSQFADC